MNIMYFGCLGVPGHFLHQKTDPKIQLEDTPWGNKIDGALLTNGRLIESKYTEPDGVLYEFHKGGWTAVCFWDRSGDSRPASNSAFLVDSYGHGETLIREARKEWPEVFSRAGFPKLTTIVIRKALYLDE